MRKNSFFALVLILSCCSRLTAQTWTNLNAPNDPIEGYVRLACSADGTIILALQSAWYKPTNSVFLSTDGGAAWITNNLPGLYWNAAGCSATGNVLLAMTSMGVVYSSTNSGASWRSNNVPDTAWNGVAGSADGTRWVACASAGENNAPIYVSHDAGVTWTPTAAPTNYWIGVASSADGNILMASGLPGVCISTNGGLTWNFGSPPPYMSGCACSADGRKMVVGDAGMQIWTSTNTGVTWTAHNLLQPFTIIAVSADGDTLAAVCDALPLPVSLSSDFGMTWSTNSNPALYGRSVAASADGCRLFVVGGGQVYSLATTPQPVLKSAVSGNQLRFSWTVPSMPFVLQQNSDLTTTNWVPVTDRPVFNPSRLEYETTVTPVPGARFYRLAQ